MFFKPNYHLQARSIYGELSITDDFKDLKPFFFSEISRILSQMPQRQLYSRNERGVW